MKTQRKTDSENEEQKERKIKTNTDKYKIKKRTNVRKKKLNAPVSKQAGHHEMKISITDRLSPVLS